MKIITEIAKRNWMSCSGDHHRECLDLHGTFNLEHRILNWKSTSISFEKDVYTLKDLIDIRDGMNNVMVLKKD